MNKESYLYELRSKLSSLPFEEREAAVSYYQEYLNDAGPQGEARAIEELGAPSKVAKQILAEIASSAVRSDFSDKELKKEKKGKNISHFLALIGGILAAPVAVPLILAALATLVAIAIAVGAVIISFYFVCAAMIGGGGLIGVFGFYFIFTEFATGITLLGGSSVMIGIGIMLLVPARIVFRLLCRVVLGISSRFFNRMKVKEALQ